MSTSEIPPVALDALRAMADGDSQPAIAAHADLIGMARASMTDPDMPAGLLAAMARGLERSEALDAEGERWLARRVELLEAIRATPAVVVEYIDFLGRTVTAAKAGMADALLAAVEQVEQLVSGVDDLAAKLGLDGDAPRPTPELELTWRSGDTFSLSPATPGQVVLAVHGAIIFHGAVDAPGGYVNNSASALDRYAERTGRLGAIAMGDVRRRFVAETGCTIEERLGLAES